MQKTIAQRLQRLLPFVTLAFLFVALTIATPHFLTAVNLASVARQTAVINIMALGMTLVIITGGIDLSVGSILAVRHRRLPVQRQDRAPRFPAMRSAATTRASN